VHWLIGMLARDTSMFTDDVWVVDSTPVECARSRETVKRSDLAGWAEYGYCASHSRYFWGLRLHLLCTVHGLSVGFALTGAKADERQVLLDILHADPELTSRNGRTRQIMIGDKNYFGAEFEATLPEAGIELLRPARKGESERPGARFFKPLRIFKTGVTRRAGAGLFGQVRLAESCDALLSRQQRTKSWITGLVSAAGGQATPTWLGLTPATGR